MCIKYIRIINCEEGMEVSNGDEGMYIDMNKFEGDFVLLHLNSRPWI